MHLNAPMILLKLFITYTAVKCTICCLEDIVPVIADDIDDYDYCDTTRSLNRQCRSNNRRAASVIVCKDYGIGNLLNNGLCRSSALFGVSDMGIYNEPFGYGNSMIGCGPYGGIGGGLYGGDYGRGFGRGYGYPIGTYEGGYGNCYPYGYDNRRMNSYGFSRGCGYGRGGYGSRSCGSIYNNDMFY